MPAMAAKFICFCVYIAIISIYFISKAEAVSVDKLKDCRESGDNCFVVGDEGQNTSLKVKVTPRNLNKLMTICHMGQDREVYKLWLNPRLRIHPTEPEQNFEFYFGKNLSSVRQNHESQVFSVWNWLKIKDEFSLDPFNVSCIGIVSNRKYSLDFMIRNPDLWYLAYLFLGVVFFFWAKSWSRNVALHYATGVSVGVVASVLIALFILSRFLPQTLRRVTYVIGLISGSIILYFIKFIQTELQAVLQHYWQYIAGYVVVFGLISFAIVYRLGPISNGRTLDLVRWMLQGVGLCLVYSGTQIPEVSIAIIMALLTVYNFPNRIKCFGKRLKYRFFRPKIRLLTEEEYIQQGLIETEKALRDLREYCRSPDCDAWRVIGRLQTPQRFANFIGGDFHMSNDELMDHDSITEYELPSDDVDDLEPHGNQIRVNSP